LDGKDRQQHWSCNYKFDEAATIEPAHVCFVPELKQLQIGYLIERRVPLKSIPLRAAAR